MTSSEQIRTDKTGIRSAHIALFTGGIDKHYASGLSRSLAMSGAATEVICSSEMISEEMQELPNISFLTLYDTNRGYQTRLRKLFAVLRVYVRLIAYAIGSESPIFHILWNYKFPIFDRTILLLYYKALGKRLVFTAHNVNAGARDGRDTLLNRISLRAQYRLVDHIFVHTEKMKKEIVDEFGTSPDHITVIPFGTYDVVPQTGLTSLEAKQKLGLRETDRAILFFGRIVPYKGLDLLVDAFLRVATKTADYKLVIAGDLMKEAEQQWRDVQQRIEQSSVSNQIVQRIGHVPDNEIELYFKAADVLALPYTQIFQSGVLFMSYSFGLPVIATDVGSFGQDVIAGNTGYVCRPKDPEDLAKAMEEYFSSELFNTLDNQRIRIRSSIQESNSWEIAGTKTLNIYARLSPDKELLLST